MARKTVDGAAQAITFKLDTFYCFVQWSGIIGLGQP